jgi:uncharacterized membrane protein YdjX (TVP38/TMEM64 family)
MTEADEAKMPLPRVRLAGRLLVLLAIAAGLVVVIRHRDALDPATLSAMIKQSAVAPLAFLAVQIIASLLFIPRAPLVMAAGLAFGIGWGLVWATVGSFFGSIIGFLVARYLNAGLLEPEKLPRIGPVLLRCESGGWRAVAALRLIPVVTHSLANYALGITRVGFGSYAVGSLLGQIPMTVAYVELGAAGGRLMDGKAGWLLPTAIGAAVLALSVLLPKLWARRA